ncbi:Serine/threonine-protein kinase rio1, partial [Coemansia sp. RSA 2607]
YFRKRGNVRTMSLRRLFEFITDGNFGTTNEEIDTELAKIQTEMDSISDELLADLRADDEVFRQSFLPRTLDEVVDYVRDVNQINEGKADELIYNKLVGLKLSSANTPNSSEVVATSDSKLESTRSVRFEDPHDDSDSQAATSDSDGEGDDDKDADSGSEDEASDDEEAARHAGSKRPEDKDAKRAHKQAVKEARREKRKTKIPKAVKKRKERATSGKRSK